MSASSTPGQVTQLLARVERGDGEAFDRLVPLVYSQLREMADRTLRRERPGHTLQPTALVNEVYLRLAAAEGIPATSRSHFLRIAARAMRQVLVDHARRRGAARRGAGQVPKTLDEALAVGTEGPPPEEVIALDDALARLDAANPRLRSVVELRFFAGLSETEIAETLGVTTRTVQRDWALARAMLYREMYPDGGGTPG